MRPHTSSHRLRVPLLTLTVSLGLALSWAPAARANPGDPPSDTPPILEGVLDDNVDLTAVDNTEYPDWPLARSMPSFDLRTEGAVPPVRDQGPHGDCWAFAATGSAMSGLTRQGDGHPGLSPAHLVYAVYNPTGIMNWKSSTGATVATAPLDDGGNDMLAAAAWAKQYGAQTEAAYPYSRATSPVPVSQLSGGAYHQRDAWIFPRSLDSQGRFNQDNVDEVQNALVSFGALSVSYHADYGQAEEVKSTVYNPAQAAVYNPPNNPRNPTNAADHAVLMIGWDDDYPATNFSTRPPGPGAWLMQNSWGTGVGNGGYFWLSYYDATMTEPWFYNLVQANQDDVEHVYSLDDGPPITRLSLSNATGYEANIFQVPAGAGEQALKAVSVYFGAPLVPFEISVYKNPTYSPTTGTLMDVSATAGTAETGEVSNAGWNRIDLDKSVTLDPGDKFAVVVKLTSPTGKATFFQESAAPVRSMDGNETLWSAQAHVVSLAGQSFISANGTSWSDTGASGLGNLAVKALTADQEQVDWSALLQPLMKLLADFLAKMLATFPNLAH